MKKNEDYCERKYELMDQMEKDFDRIDNDLKNLKRELNQTICELEVEDFLLNGPGGDDPA